MEVCEKSFELAADHLQMLKYTGPLALSCDDTKLHATFRLYWDSEKKAHFLVGATDGPLHVLNPDQVKDAIEEAKERKATKVMLVLVNTTSRMRD